MTYFKMNGVDYSPYVNQLTVKSAANFNSQTNAAGNTVVDYINTKRVITVGFIPMKDSTMINILAELDKFNISLSFRNPRTNSIEDNLNCITTDREIDYYTINVNGVMYNAFTVEFIEL